jgi:hypothetical protein
MAVGADRSLGSSEHVICQQIQPFHLFSEMKESPFAQLRPEPEVHSRKPYCIRLHIIASKKTLLSRVSMNLQPVACFTCLLIGVAGTLLIQKLWKTSSPSTPQPTPKEKRATEIYNLHKPELLKLYADKWIVLGFQKNSNEYLVLGVGDTFEECAKNTDEHIIQNPELQYAFHQYFHVGHEDEMDHFQILVAQTEPYPGNCLNAHTCTHICLFMDP